jgi:hypothetical protein
MVAKLYLDGCSFTHGQGLPRNQNLGYLFEHLGEYSVTDLSRNGKSNLIMCLDAYQHCADHDVFVLGFTYSSRFGLKYQDQDIDFYAGYNGRGFDLDPQDLDLATQQVYKYFYSVFDRPYCDDLSNMLIDTTVAFLKSQGKKVVTFSWEQRQTSHELFYPYFANQDRLEDGHLNAQGTKKLYQQLSVLIDQS